jgi:hypothetical protein
MKKITLLVGVAAGFVLGSRAGREPYDKIEAKVKATLNRKDVQDALDEAKSTATEQVSAVAGKVAAKVPGVGGTEDKPAEDKPADTEHVVIPPA